MTLTIIPATFAQATEFVACCHRHHAPPRGHKFSIAVADETGYVRGVAIVGRPVARGADDGLTLEVTRVATDGAKNACSMLYGATRRAARALGYRRLITYTLKSEPGTSLRAAGWIAVAEVKGRAWSCESRPRAEHRIEDKVRWEAAA